MQNDPPKVSTKPTDIKHAPVITPYDRENFATYLVVHDAHKDGLSDAEIVKYIWGSVGLVDVHWIVQEHLRRAKWFISAGYLHLQAESPVPRDQALDNLVQSGAMTEQERAFLDSPEGEVFWPRPKH